MNMKINRLLIIISLLFIVIVTVLLLYNSYRIKNAKVIVKLKDDLTAEVYSKAKISEYIKKINGKLLKDKIIDTSKVGIQTNSFEFVNEDNIRISYSFDIEIVDSTPPVISGKNIITLSEGFEGDILDNFLCGDNYDDDVKCKIVGDYDVNQIGTYPVILKARDSSKNESSHSLTIKIIPSEDNDEIEEPNDYTYFNEVIKKYKTKTNKIGIDVSKWEGNIDFKKVKEAGAEFVYIRMGYQKGRDGKYLIDPNFRQNYEGFKNQNIKIGVYFFSHADSKEEARNQAKWVLRELKNYDIDLEVVYDWENWYGFSKYNLSFYNLTLAAKTFMKYVEDNGYMTMHYSSKYYLENVWFDTGREVWLAHYTDNTDYKGKYKVWQICENGKIAGIEDTVDIDIMNEVW